MLSVRSVLLFVLVIFEIPSTSQSDLNPNQESESANNSSNSTSPRGGTLLYQPYIIVYLFLTATASTVGIAGNFMTMATFALTKALHNTRNAFIVNLAVADLLVTGIVMPYSIFGVVAGQVYFEDRPALCSFLATVCAPGCLASMFTICSISCTRFYYICKFPLYMKYFTKRNTTYFIMLIWILCLLVHFPNHVGWGRSRYSTGFLLCTLDMETLSYSFFYGCWMVVAIISTFYFYFKIYQKIRHSSLSVKMITAQSSNDTHHDSSLTKEIKLAKTSFKIFIIFVSTWSPTALLILMGINGFVPLPVYLYSVLMAHSNSTFNFFIYYVDNEMFRTGFKKLIKKVVFKNNAVSTVVTGSRGSQCLSDSTIKK